MRWHKNEHSKFWLQIMRMLPKKVLYWAVIQSYVYATTEYSEKTPDEITWSEVCDVLS